MKKCFICGRFEGEIEGLKVKTYIFHSSISGETPFEVCSKCVSEKTCPRCWGNKRIGVRDKRGSATEICDICFGEGFVEYSTH